MCWVHNCTICYLEELVFNIKYDVQWLVSHLIAALTVWWINETYVYINECMYVCKMPEMRMYWGPSDLFDHCLNSVPYPLATWVLMNHYFLSLSKMGGFSRKRILIFLVKIMKNVQAFIKCGYSTKRKALVLLWTSRRNHTNILCTHWQTWRPDSHSENDCQFSILMLADKITLNR